MLTIDNREQGCILPVQTYFESKGVEVRVAKMEFGDYRFEFENCLICGSPKEVEHHNTTTVTNLYLHQFLPRIIIIERKTPSDFINSTHATVKDPASKLSRQLNGCLETGAEVILLIDGAYFPIKGGKIKTQKITLKHSAEGFASKLRTVQAHGIRVEYNMAEWFLPAFLHGLYTYEQKEAHFTLASEPKSFTIPKREDAKWTTLMGIRGVGPVMARTLVEGRTIHDLANMSVDELQAIKGVGPKMAETLNWYLN